MLSIRLFFSSFVRIVIDFRLGFRLRSLSIRRMSWLMLSVGPRVMLGFRLSIRRMSWRMLSVGPRIMLGLLRKRLMLLLRLILMLLALPSVMRMLLLLLVPVLVAVFVIHLSTDFSR
jgi:hypothetical protein